MLTFLGRVFLLLFLFLPLSSVSFGSNIKFRHDFAFFCKSYSKDVDKAVILYQSFLNNSDKNYPFYFIVPKKDLALFKREISKLRKKNSCFHMPNFLIEERVLRKCNIYNKIYNGIQKFRHGWFVQQMVKMCISQIEISEEYVTLDSDTYFVKKINKGLFYKDGKLKLVGRKIGDDRKAMKFFNLTNSTNEDQHRYETASFIRYIFRPTKHGESNKYLPFYDFVSHYALWDSNIMNEMKDYIKERMSFDFYDLIKLSPWEMQWYGQFIQSKHKERFYLMDSDFTLTLGYENEAKKDFRCLPENGYNRNYLVANQSKIGYKMPNTLFCKIKSRLNYLHLFFLRKFLWRFVY